jgi:hypothetical protein
MNPVPVPMVQADSYRGNTGELPSDPVFLLFLLKLSENSFIRR